MRHACRNAALLLFYATGFFPLVGCGEEQGRSSISGTVTYEGQPLETGFVNFLPQNGDGPTAAGEVTKGQFSVTGIFPGKKRVQIQAADQSRTYSSPAPTPNTKDSAIFPPNAIGNNQTIEIIPGSQTLDFKLKKP